MRISVYRGGAQRPSSLLWRRTMKKYLFALLPVVVAALVWFGLLSQSNRNTTATQAVEVVSVVSGKQWLTALFVALTLLIVFYILHTLAVIGLKQMNVSLGNGHFSTTAGGGGRRGRWIFTRLGHNFIVPRQGRLKLNAAIPFKLQ